MFIFQYTICVSVLKIQYIFFFKYKKSKFKIYLSIIIYNKLIKIILNFFKFLCNIYTYNILFCIVCIKYLNIQWHHCKLLLKTKINNTFFKFYTSKRWSFCVILFNSITDVLYIFLFFYNVYVFITWNWKITHSKHKWSSQHKFPIRFYINWTLQSFTNYKLFDRYIDVYFITRDLLYTSLSVLNIFYCYI